MTDLIGIGVGHIYYFFEDVYPLVAEIRGWNTQRWLEAPSLLKRLCGEYREEIRVEEAVPVVNQEHEHND